MVVNNASIDRLACGLHIWAAMAPKSHEPARHPSCNPTVGTWLAEDWYATRKGDRAEADKGIAGNSHWLKLARKEENRLSLDPVLYYAISGPIQELSKHVAVATSVMATAEAETPRPFSEGVLPDLDQKTWALKRKDVGSLTYELWNQVVWEVFLPHDLHIMLHFPLCFPMPLKVMTAFAALIALLFHFLQM